MTRRVFSALAASFCGAIAGQSSQTEQRPVPASSGRRAALVMGNGRYSLGKLDNPVHDAGDISLALKRVHFEVATVLDADLSTMRHALDTFCSGMHDGDVALLYYAGHGMQLDAENYLVPIEYQHDPRNGELGVKTRCLAASGAREVIQRSAAATCVFILDACRENPFRPSDAMPPGLALMDPVLGTYIALAAGPGQVASDNEGERNGLFTKHLLAEIGQPGQSIDQLFGNVKRRVFEESGQHQRPWLHSDLIAEFYFGAATSGGHHSSAESLIESGRRRFEAKDFEQAKQYFEQAMHIQPENAFLYNALGATYVQMRQPSVAISAFGKAIELKPDYGAAYFNRGAAYHNAGRYELAVQDFSWAIEQEAFDPLAYDLRGRAYFSLRDYDNAKSDFDRALELNPADWIALLSRGRVLFRRAELTQAVADLSKSLHIHRSAEAFEVRSQAYRAMNRIREADADHQSALQMQQQ
jgi:uncharacterized caspase-like protein